MVIIVKGRFAFLNSLFDAKQFDGVGDFSYAATMLVEPGSADAKIVEDAIQIVSKEAWADKGPITVKAISGNNQKMCWYNGDTKAHKYEDFAGMMVLTAKRKEDKGHPDVVGVKGPGDTLTKASGKPYPGSYGKLKIDIWAQKKAPHGPAIRATLIAVQFLADGDAFGPTGPATSDGFQDESSDSDTDQGGLI